ncbi:hypothetical protein HQ393_05740 [Chitinibacter bivalviorum]|uniref:Polysaccharide biosynthesis tyrosine autokinase n=1 Tax=Chitinibacter bivalviorum TaxID=2739434 RepID=A0A7H9BHW8_9NEIS|nr:hypothetical protein [Chitinibacter bivalviorum]QLG87798.1 hypothetical protein HQ393_05740 [Chitinibacter bivalviorum]
MSTNLSAAGIGIKPLVSLRQHPKLAVISCLLVLIASLPLVWIKGKPNYSSEAVVQVAPRYMKTLKDDNELDFQSNSQYRQFVQQQMSTLLRYDILADGMKRAKVPFRLAAESEQYAVDRLRNLLQVAAVPDTYMVRISMYGQNKAQMAPLINSVVNVYLERARTEQVFGRDDRISKLQNRQAELLKLIDEKSERRNQIAGELGIATFSAEAGNPYDKAIERLREALAEAKIKRFDAEAHEKAFHQHGDTDPSVRSIMESVSVDPGLNSLKASLNNRRATLVSGMAGLTAKHPGYEQSQIELGDIDNELNRQTDKLTNSVRRNLESRFATASTQAKQLEAQLQSELAEQEKSRGHYATLFKEANEISGQITQTRKEVETIQDRLNFFAGETSSLGFVRLVSAALPPEIPQGPGYKKLLLMAILAALGAGIFIPILRDLLDRTIHAPNDVISSFGFAPVGWLIQSKDHDSALFLDNQLRRLASALIREQDRTGIRIFGISSLQPGGGASSLTQQLMNTFQNMGIAALAVDANAFSRDSFFDQSTEYTIGEDLPSQLAQLNSLRLKANGRHLQAIDKLGVSLEKMAETFRFVLVDVPPLLVSGDAELTLRATPAILAVVEAEAQSRGEVTRAARLLQGIDPASIGVVVNQVRPLDGGGYVRDLMTEFIEGRKTAKAGKLTELWLTAQVIGKACRSLMQELYHPLRFSRRSSHDTL